ncbi:hypothetical protein SGLAM104S_00767 [Streptomyces glaucescens]
MESEVTQREGAQQSFVHVAQRVQAIVHQQAKELREMEEDHGRNHEVFQDLLRIDHGNALIGRLADSVSVLGGGRPGRQRPLPVALYSVLRGAMSRILEYKRIELKSIAKVNIRGVSVEPVIHACAEILDNATRYSPPQTQVHVTAHEVQYGVAIEIEDCGAAPQRGVPRAPRGTAGHGRGGHRPGGHRGRPAAGLRRRRPSVQAVRHADLAALLGVRRSAGGARGAADHDDRRAGRARLRAARHRRHSRWPQIDLATGSVEGPKRKPKIRRRPTNPKHPRRRCRMEDDVPVVTEWTENGLPQRRSRVTDLASASS